MPKTGKQDILPMPCKPLNHIILFFSVIATCFCFIGNAEAAGCVMRKELISKLDIVFKGEVLGSEKLKGDEMPLYDLSNTATRFKVLRKYKGANKSEVKIRHYSEKNSSADSYLILGKGSEFIEGDVVYVFASLIDGQNAYTLTACPTNSMINFPNQMILEDYKAVAEMYEEVEHGLSSQPITKNEDIFFRAEFYKKQALFFEEYDDFEGAMKSYEQAIKLVEQSKRNMGGYGEELKLGIARSHYHLNRDKEALDLVTGIITRLEDYKVLTDGLQVTLNRAKSLRERIFTE